MPERIGWSEHEAALLLWILQDVLNGKMNRQDAIREASKMLRTMALNQGKTIDDAYRNEAGITFQLYGLEGVWLNGKTPIGRKTTWMTNICDVYRRNHQRFDRLVQEAKEMCNASSEDSNFWKWLSIRNSDEQLLRLRAGYHDLNTYGCNGKSLSKPLDEIEDIFELQRIQGQLDHDVVFRFKYRKMLEPMQEVFEEYIRYRHSMQENADDRKKTVEIQTPISKVEEAPVGVEEKEATTPEMGLETEATVDEKPMTSDKEMDAESKKEDVISAEEKEKPVVASEIKMNVQPKAAKKDGIVDFDCAEYDRFNTIKPKSFEYFGEKTNVTLWQPLYIGVCKKLADDYPFVFLAHDGASIAGTKPELATTPGIRQMRQPRSIYRTENGEWFFAETYFRPSEILLRIKTLMDWCNIDYGNLIIEYEVPKRSTRSGWQTYVNPQPESIKNETDQTWLPYDEWARQSGFEDKEIENDLWAFQKLTSIIEKDGLSTHKITEIHKVFVLDQIWNMIKSTQEWEDFTLEEKYIAKDAIGRYIQYCTNNGKVFSRGKSRNVNLGRQAFAEGTSTAQTAAVKNDVSSEYQSNVTRTDAVNSSIENMKKAQKRKYDFSEWAKRLGYGNSETSMTFYNLELLEAISEKEKIPECELLFIDDSMELARIWKSAQNTQSWKELSAGEKFGIGEAVKRYTRYLIQNRINSTVASPKPSSEEVKEVTNSVFSAMEKNNASTTSEDGQSERTHTLGENKYILDLSNIPDLAFTRPVSMELLGQDYKVHLWKDVYVLTIRELYKAYASKFDSLVGNFKSGIGLYLDTANNAYRMRSPKQVTRSTFGKTLFVETNKNASSIANSLKKILEFCGCGYNLLTVRYEKNNVDEAELPEKRNAQSTQKWETLKKEQHQNLTPSVQKNVVTIADEPKHSVPILPKTIAIPTVAEQPHQTVAIPTSAVSTAGTYSANASLNEKQQHYVELLKEAFPDGFKAGSAIATKKMQIAYQNKYGEEPAESKEEIMTIVQQIGTLRDGRIYPRNQSQLLSEINSEILRLLNEGATCVYCDAVFDRYRERLADEQHIYNSDALRDPLLDLARKQYCVKYGAFCLPDREADISLDVLMCMRSHAMPATYDDLREELWYIPLDKIKKALMDDPAIVNVGDNTYFYAPNLPVSKEEQRVIASELESELGYHSYTTTAQLMKLIHEKCPTVEINTEGLSTLTIRNSLSYLLRKNFNFRSNIISSITTQPPVDTKQAFSEFCREHETMTTTELQAFADEVDTVIYWDSVFSEMIRISERDWVRKDHIQWTPEAIDAKLDEMCEGDYLIIKDVCLFLQFPVVGYRWNSFLLESYVNSYSPTYKLLHASFSAYDCCGAIVKKSSQIKNYHDLAVDVLANDDAWKDQQGALQTLVDKGLQQRRTLSDIVQVTKEARLKREKRQKEVH